jgi:hypothetical protein
MVGTLDVEGSQQQAACEEYLDDFKQNHLPD